MLYDHNFHFKNTLKKLFISRYYHSSYSTDNYNNQTEAMDRLFITYVTPKIKEIYRPSIIQDWKLNIDAAEYEKCDFIKFTLYKFFKIV